MEFYQDKDFTEVDFPTSGANEYNNCTFTDINYYQAVLSGCIFKECKFINTNFSNAKLDDTTLFEVEFINCKLMGVDFSNCTKTFFSVSFENCILNFTTFISQNLTKTNFINCSIQDANIIDSNFSNCNFVHCDFKNTIFERVNLEKADFTSAKNYLINPENNKIKKAKFSIPEIVGLLVNLDIVIK